MIGSLGTQNASLSLATLSPGASKTRDDKDKKDPVDTLAEFLKKVAPEEVDSWQQQIDDSKRVLSQLQSSRSDINEQRKAAAQQKLDQLKARIQMLRMMAAVNPEAAAKMAKQLARELASAAKEYAAASGGASAAGGVGGVSVPSIPSAPAGDATATSTTAVAGAAVAGATSLTGGGLPAAATGAGTAGGVTAQASAEAGANTTGAEASSPPEGQSTGDASVPGEQTAAAGAVAPPETTSPQEQQEASDQPGTPETPQERREKERAAIEGQAKENAASIAGAFHDGDNQFVTDVRWMKDMLNSIIQAAKRQIELEKNPDSKRDIKEAEGALQETEEALDAITGGVMAGIGAVNILV